MNHLFEIGSLFGVGIDVLGDNMANLFESEYVMATFVFFVEADASFGFADGCLVRAGEAASQLYGGSPVDVA